MRNNVPYAHASVKMVWFEVLSSMWSPLHEIFACIIRTSASERTMEGGGTYPSLPARCAAFDPQDSVKKTRG